MNGLDPDNIIGWSIVGGIALVALLFLGGMTCLIVHEMREASARHECRVSGHRVIANQEHGEWWCAPIAPERAP